MSIKHPSKPKLKTANIENDKLDLDKPVVKHDDLAIIPDAPIGQKIAMAIAVITPFLGVIAAIALMWQYGWMGWPYLAMFLVFWALSGLGITVGFHRLLTHRSFETYRWVRLIWMSLGALSVEGAPLTWCAIHRKHHGQSDQAGDPHSPHLHGSNFWGMIKGLWYSQVGWLFAGYWSKPELERYVPDLLKDRLLVFCNNAYWLFVVVSLAAPTLLGAGFVYFLGDGSQPVWFGALLGFILGWLGSNLLYAPFDLVNQLGLPCFWLTAIQVRGPIDQQFCMWCRWLW